MACLLTVLSGGPAQAQQPPEKALKGLDVAEGFEITLFASESLVNNPTAIDVDAQGRVWVAEGVNYRHSIRGPQVGAPDPKADRIKVLEDTDGDGRADKVTVFADGLIVPMSVAVAGRKVYVGESPHLWVFQDTDGDGRADKKESLLEGFRGRDHDHGIHGLVLGPDGRLYFTIGDEGMDVTDRGGNRVAPQAGAMLRVNLDGTGLTALADNFRNPYELAVDAWGNVFCSDNDIDGRAETRICWILEGGSYGWKGPESPTGQHWREDLPGYVPKILATGAGSPCGILIYEGELLPAKYRGALLHADAGPHQVRAYHLTPTGAGYAAEVEVLVTSDDTWFRPVDVAAHPDGSIFIADWYDAGVGGHRYSDLDTGRIYRLAPKGAEPARAPDVNLDSLTGLLAAFLNSPAPAVRFLAVDGLLERGDEAVEALTRVAQGQEGTAKARALTLLARFAQGRACIRQFADDSDPATRAQVVRLLRDEGEDDDVPLFLALADDPEAQVRREVLLALRNVPTGVAADALTKLVAGYDGRDRFYLKSLGLALRGRAPEFLSRLLGPTTDNPRLAASVELAWELHHPGTVPFLAEVFSSRDDDKIKRRCLEALRNVSDPRAGAVVAGAVFTQRGNPTIQRLALNCLAYNLDSAWKDRGPYDGIIRKGVAIGLAAPEVATAAIEAIRRGQMADFGPELIRIAQAKTAPSEHRLAAVRALGDLHVADAIDTVEQIVADRRIDPDDPKVDPNQPADPLAVAALRARFAISAKTDDAYWRVLVSDRRFPNAVRREVVRLVGSTPAGSRYLLDLVERYELPAELKGVATAVVHRQPDEDIKARAEQLLPLPKSAEGRTLPPIATLVRRDGDPERGRTLFFRKAEQGALCARCHRVQREGESIGPDLSAIGAKLAREALFDSILNPSAGIAHEYRPYAVALTNGQVLTGLLSEPSADRVVLKTAEGDPVVLDRSQIDEQVPQDVSLMPEDLSTTLTEQELVDIVAFLETLRDEAAAADPNRERE